MRRMTLDEIKSRTAAKGQSVDYAVNVFRSQSKDQGWVMRRTRQRDADEIKALNHLYRIKLREGIKNNTVYYDKERRVLTIDEYRKS